MSEAMLGWEAVEVMRKDPEARFRYGETEYRWADGRLECLPVSGAFDWHESHLDVPSLGDDWTRVVKPLTDEELAAKWVDEHKQDIQAGGVWFGRNAPKANRKAPAKLYEVKGKHGSDSDSE